MTSYCSLLYLAVFLPAAVLVYRILPQRLRWVALLAASYAFFWSVSGKLLVFLLFSTVSIHYFGLWLTAEQQDRDRRRILLFASLLQVGTLITLKYAAFFSTNLNTLLHALRLPVSLPVPAFLLPIGISFYTLQALSYLLDVYRGTIRADRNLARLAIFLGFFPQIMEGPICRYGQTAQQLWEGRPVTWQGLTFGMQRILFGLIKKIVIADRLNLLIKTVFNDYALYDGGVIALAMVCYTCQLYMDFSGTMDVVIGSAEIFGVHLPENFRQPFFSKSIGEFWRRWHITLGTWMKDYIFYPFSLSKQMNRFGKWSKKHLGNTVGKAMPICLADLLIFFVVGIWHGAAWKYIAYGMYNGIIIAVSSLLEPLYAKGFEKTKIHKESKAWTVVQIIRTFILVNIGWYFDMAVSFSAALVMMKETFTKMSMSQFTGTAFLELGMGRRDFLIVLAGCIIIFIVSLLKERGVAVREAIAAKPLIVRWAIWYAFIVIIFIFAYTGDGSAFIYANF